MNLVTIVKAAIKDQRLNGHFGCGQTYILRSLMFRLMTKNSTYLIVPVLDFTV